ncbi:hypothetical protein Syun_022043 [Stephania yunnanensis]|uniref:FBD domain-containing protein n=1 Tax=Stephania yunnanensis TaxID=152371 RepID=A0AAP0II68_9MAGN
MPSLFSKLHQCRRLSSISLSSSHLSRSINSQTPNSHKNSNFGQISQLGHFNHSFSPPPPPPPHLLFSNLMLFRSFSVDVSSNKGLENDGLDHKIGDSGGELGKLDLGFSGGGDELGVGGGEWYDPAVQMVVDLLDWYHGLTGLPWWITIASSTLALRVVLLPVLILQLKKLKRIAELFPKTSSKTSLLSKNYRTFWTTAPSSSTTTNNNNNNNLHFAITNVYSMNLFRQFLLRRGATNTPTILHRVSIQWWPLCESKLINALIATALIHSVKHLDISLAPRSAEFIVRPHDLASYTLPTAMLAAPSLETLTLDRVWLDGGVPAAWPDLEGLVLVDCGVCGNNGRLVLRGEKLRRVEVVNYNVLDQAQWEEEEVVEMETPMVEFVSYRDQYGSIECWFGRVEAWDGDVDVDDWFSTCRIWSRVQQGCCGSQAPLDLAHHVRVVADGTFQDPSSLNTEIAFEWPMSCNLNKLKYVAVRGVEGFDCELEFFKLLLGSAVNLQRMVIVESASDYFQHKRRVLEQFRNNLSKQFPQARFSIQLV